MPMKYVIDTHALIWFLEGNQRLGTQAQAILSNVTSQLVLPAIALSERKITDFALHQEAAEWFAKERARLIPISLTPSYADGQIAAIAKVNNLILVTRNVADYANFQDLQIENWFS
ncbi:MAG: type II toxin-antitoxin system VapC family toxin [Microcoleus sp. CSU_2_2]|nr:type II toxin-antitoxin system VapC family toxin [Microcoleus sp. SU_5_3]NJS09808.1 type II toxin-antitoxin system VapC family toxin [Microcoleus sp. CSU_2_2]